HVIYCCVLFSAPPAPEIYTLSLHDALPISDGLGAFVASLVQRITGDYVQWNSYAGTTQDLKFPSNLSVGSVVIIAYNAYWGGGRSEEHTSELQSRENLVCRLLLEKKKKQTI